MTNRIDRIRRDRRVCRTDESEEPCARRPDRCAAAAMIGLAGCGSDSSDTNSRPRLRAPSGAQVEIGNTINYGSVGTTAEIDCADGKSLNIGGNNNTLTVKGTCANANIGGADNTVNIRPGRQGASASSASTTPSPTRGRPEGQRHRLGQQDQQGLSHA